MCFFHFGTSRAGETAHVTVTRNEGDVIQGAQQKIERVERKEAIAAARRAGMTAPYEVERVPAAVLLKSFDVKALTADERAELKDLDVRSPLCGRGDGSPMEPCPTRQGTQFGVLRGGQGGCVWSPTYGMPATQEDLHGPFVSLRGLRCGIGQEWSRIQKTALPR
jgi:hypothetical protein